MPGRRKPDERQRSEPFTVIIPAWILTNRMVYVVRVWPN